MGTTKPKAPKHLKAATRRWYEAVVGEYRLEDHHLRLLLAAAEAWDRATDARIAVQEHGLTYTDRFGCPRGRPEVKIERESKAQFARLLRELGLDVSEPEAPRPPTIQGRGR